jgi:hypothetical protein
MSEGATALARQVDQGASPRTDTRAAQSATTRAAQTLDRRTQDSVLADAIEAAEAPTIASRNQEIRMYPHVRQLTTRWPEQTPEPHTEIRARSAASTPSERPRRSAGRSRHKLALLTWASAYAVITAILAALGPTLASWPLALRTLVLSGLMVVALTWLIMPVMTRLFRPWLAPSA